jgi:hypothetical protein
MNAHHGYIYLVEQMKVCKKFFSFAYGVDSKTICSILRNGVRTDRIRDVPSHKRHSIITWLDHEAKDFEWMPNNQHIQLPYRNRDEVYELYMKDVTQEKSNKITTELKPVTRRYFKKIWRKHRSHIIIRKHLQFSKCGYCDKYQEKMKETRDHIKRAAIKEEANRHIEYIKQEREYYYSKRMKATTQPNKYLSIIIDGADQSIYEMPHFHTTTKGTDGLLKHGMHMVGGLVHGRGSYIYTANEKYKKDSNFLIEITQRTLQHLESQNNKPLPKILYLQFDNAADNKNKYVLSYLNHLVHRNIFSQIELSFLPVGHTHEDIDQMWSCHSNMMTGIIIILLY